MGLYNNMNPNNSANLQMQKKHEEEMSALQRKMDSIKARSLTPDKQGYMTIGGGENKYGFEKPEFITQRGADGELLDRFKEGLNPTLQGMLDKYSVEGDTKWAQMQREMIENSGTKAMEDAQKQNLSGLAQARSGLAMRGGLRAGAGERMAMGGQRSLMSNLQNIGRQTRDQNLQLSIQDEEMKNQVMGRIGDTQQGILGRNINRLSTDINNQNQFMSKRYSDDMAAYGAEQQARAQRKAACFVGGTKVRMANGREKAIRNVRIGEKLMEGGEVYAKLEAICEDLHWYKDVKVAGSHAVLEDGEWVRVRDSKHSKPIKGRHMVYNLGTDQHLIIAEGHTFSDLHETEYYEDITEEQSLEVLNGRNVKELLS